MDSQESHPLPDDPALAQVASVMNDAEHWAWVVDERWRLVHMTDALRLSFGDGLTPVPIAIGCHLFGPEAQEISRGWRFGPNSPERQAVLLKGIGGWLLADTPGGVEELRTVVDPSLHGILDELKPAGGETIGFTIQSASLFEAMDIRFVGLRVRRRRMAGWPAPS